MPENPFSFLLGPKEPPRRSPVGQRLDRAFESVAKCFGLVVPAGSDYPAVATAALEQMETCLLEATDHVHQALEALRGDPVAAMTPVPVKKEVAP